MDFHISYLPILIAFIAILYRFILYPAFWSPLAAVPPAHWSCRFSSLWLLWVRWSQKENRTVYEQHMRKGPAVRLAPKLVSLNCFEDGLRAVYQGGFPKVPFYFHGFANYETENIFTFEDNASHTARKRLISNTFSKSFIMSSQTARAAIRDVLFGDCLAILEKAAVHGTPVEVLELNYSYSMDTFVQWQFGKSLRSHFLRDSSERGLYLDGFFAPAHYTFWRYEFPQLTGFLRRLGIFLIPAWVDAAYRAVEDWNLVKCDKAQQLLATGTSLSPEDQPVVFEQALKTMSKIDSKPRAYPQRLQIASDMFAHNSAAFETSGNVETYLFYEMCRNPEWQEKLREELLTLNPPLRFDPTRKFETEDIAQPQDVDSLPILHAIIMETLRLWAPVPGGQPRKVPKACTLGGVPNIPAGTIVQCSAYSLHRTPEVFPDPHRWNPQRWLDASPAHLATMKHWFWAFGSGGRMCIGSHFAFYSMKYLIAGVYTNYRTTIHDHGDMEAIDEYMSGPKGHRLEVKFHKIE
ncbi:uncharacterized protein Z520_02394 [Fonsecaea multimorphosa CBS 102226]|uniref:Cytochrome P450 n=1 Tax=Fonsecaea multimorphosa CBS 102226 TaxID=1442371 RepID=A0A0D2HK25_9EURO|nr:uncharacterized protein Z520_02394 [Fonsecaea multimorphosa CBS 102226]KIY02256.1 hypothetical protein Z520_02394 [Fonsecaea multimorphosa CBS 102226]OAL28904.1 hypothetical protein AYO22_02340 [Fonsecaea multimorphosa]